MPKRKRMFQGEGLPDRLEIALGIKAETGTVDFDEIYASLPSLDWDALEQAAGLELDRISRDEVEEAFKLELLWRDPRHPSQQNPVDNRIETFSEFQAFLREIEKHANFLRQSINELAELSPSMLMPPKSEGWLTGEVERSHVLDVFIHQRLEPKDEEFFDYVAFRKLLDHYCEIGQLLDRFSDYYGRVYQTHEERHWFDYFMRRALLSMMPSFADFSVAIPTDTNPHHASPVVLFFLETQRQYSIHIDKSANPSHQVANYSYRQIARRVLSLRSEFEESDMGMLQLELRSAYKR
ncbi:MAG: hypothetical protein AAGM21_09730 [Pseudomonadota bacterium]